MDRTEATTQIVVALINNGQLCLNGYSTSEEKSKTVAEAFSTIFETVKACEQNRG